MKLVELSDRTLAVEPIYVDSVVDDSTIVVFLHEALGSIGQWKSFPSTICHQLKMNGFVYERQGYGQSSALKDERTNRYLHDYAWDELPELIEAILPKEKKVLLIGHSDGASIALLYAAKFPQRVKAVVSMAAHVIVEEVTLNGISPAVTAYKAGKLEGLKKYHGEKTETLFYAWATTWNLPSFRDWNICDDISTIQCPVLAFQGSNDQYGTKKQLELIQKSVQNDLVEISELSNCGHHPHLEVPVKCEELISSFVRNLR